MRSRIYRFGRLGRKQRNPKGGRKQPPNASRAELLRCIRNHPTTLERRAAGVIAEHVSRPLPGHKQPFAPDPRCAVCRRPTNEHAAICPEPARLARRRRAEASA